MSESGGWGNLDVYWIISIFDLGATIYLPTCWNILYVTCISTILDIVSSFTTDSI